MLCWPPQTPRYSLGPSLSAGRGGESNISFTSTRYLALDVPFGPEQGVKRPNTDPARPRAFRRVGDTHQPLYLPVRAHAEVPYAADVLDGNRLQSHRAEL